MTPIKKAMDVIETAVECDREGMIFQALTYYGEGCQLLMKALQREDNQETQSVYGRKIDRYVGRAEEIKGKVKSQMAASEHVSSIWIREDSEWNSYGVVFGNLLNARLNELLLEEPLLDEKFHFQDLTKFLELVVHSCPNISFISITTMPSKRDARYQLNTLNSIKKDMDARLIIMSYRIDENMLIDPKIILNSGQVIKMSRGLHYFKFPNALFNLGLCDFNLRKCHQAHIDVYGTEPFFA